MFSPLSEAISTSDVSIISQWQDVLALPVEISQKLSGGETSGVRPYTRQPLIESRL